MLIKKVFALVVLGALTTLMPFNLARADETASIQMLIDKHQKAAADAKEKAAFHEQMEKEAASNKMGGKFDMVGHCRFWADYYRNLAVKEEKAAADLQKISK